jgi:hypothetical protein
MDLVALRNYRKWIDQSPYEVHAYVIWAGGWKQVFQDGVPRWASRVRNYFNVTPQKLTRLADKLSETLVRGIQRAIVAADCAAYKRIKDQFLPRLQLPKGCPAHPDPSAEMGFFDTIGTRGALSGEAYIDDNRRIWYQMDPGAAVYHYGEKPWWPGGAAVWASVFEGQKQVPVFKLVSPDDTGGSMECIITNPQDVPYTVGRWVFKMGRSDIGAVDDAVDVSHRIVTDPVKEGSYNYAETVAEGLTAHNRFDVDTDPMTPTFFVDPPDRFSSLLFRRFPEKDPDGYPLADQVKY